MEILMYKYVNFVIILDVIVFGYVNLFIWWFENDFLFIFFLDICILCL